MKKLIFLMAVCVLLINPLTHCTVIGPTGTLPEMNMGPNVEVNIAIYKDRNISNERVNSIMTAIYNEFIQYGLIVKVFEIKDWKRSGFGHDKIFRDIVMKPLGNADRNLALVSRDFRDFLWGMLLPETLGAVDLWTHTRGYVVAEVGSLTQILTFRTPEQAAVHEFYHMLGVEHMDGRKVICEKIIRLKQAAIRNRQEDNMFFPGVTETGDLILTTLDADRQFLPTSKI